MEENRKGQGTLFLVISIATLLVAIIGATFAYFSAQVSAEGNKIQGGTNTGLGTALSLVVERVTFAENQFAEGGEAETPTDPTDMTAYNNLVPAIIDYTVAGVEKAVEEKCVANGYTGCHLYRIKASSTQDIPKVSIRLANLTLTGVTDKYSWKYVLYNSEDGQPDTVTSLITDTKNAERTFGAFTGYNTYSTPTDGGEVVATPVDPVYTYVDGGLNGFDMHAGDEIKANTPVYYYLLVYLENKDATQNPTDTTDKDSGTGTYGGIITMDAAGGKVVASFSTTVNTEPETGA